jgi:hypothetical protein
MSNKKNLADVLLEMEAAGLYNVEDYSKLFAEVVYPQLIETKEFEDVKSSSRLSLPVYKNEIDEIIKLGGTIDDILSGGTLSQTKSVVDYRYKPDEDVLIFNDHVQIYDIRLSCKIYQDKDLPCGIWYHPVYYNPVNFQPTRKLEFKFNPETLQDMLAFNLKQEIIDKMFSLIESGVSNVPFEPVILIRCSSESIKSITKKENTNR